MEMTRHDFIEKFGITPEKCKEIMVRFTEIVNAEAEEIIEHADYYIDPTSYCDEEYLKEEYGEDALDKYDDSDGYPNLYDYKKMNSPESLFKELISYHTSYGGMGTAMAACSLIGLGEGWNEQTSR